ncbi:MAG: PAS domain S-box protein [Planctomycetota bacterium]|nr:PAS domain S-box protein [Planctomycetota bacterium]
MSDQDKTKEQLIAELAAMRLRVAELEEYAGERKRVEEKLHEREERYRSFVKSIPVIAYRGRMDFSVEFFHGAVNEITGYSEQDFTSGEINWGQVICPEDFVAIRDSIEKVSSVPYYSTEREYHILRKDGHTRWVHEVVHNTCDSSGKPAYVQGVIFDVTDRKRAEEALKESEQNLQEAHDRLEQRVQARTAELREANQRLGQEIEERQEVEYKFHIISDSALDALVMMDPEGKAAHWNPAAEAMFGYSGEEILGRDLHGILAPSRYQQQAASGLSEFFKSGQGKAVGRILELQAARKDGSEFPIELSVSRIKMDGKWGAVAVVRDITDRKRTVEALRESEETARALLNALTESELLLEYDGTIITLNETAAARLGGTVAELIGKSVNDFMAPHLVGSRRKQVEKVARTRLPVRFEDERDGRIYDNQIYPIYDAAASLARLAVYSQDITERRKAEGAFRREHRELKRLLEARDHELKIISYEIHDGIAQLLVGTIMQFDVYNLLKGVAPEEAKKACDTGQQMVAECLSEVRRLIGRVRLPLLDEEGVLAAVQNLVYESNDKSEAEIEFHSQVRFGRLEPVLENAIYRIVQEGLENARRHSNSKRVRVELAQEAGKVRVEIRDWGVGFSPDDVGEKSFGLGGIRERARLLEGCAAIDSTPGEGTRIVVELPLAPGELDEPEDADKFS